MATYFQEGKVYTNSATAYGLRPRDQRNDTAAASMPAVTLVCTAVTPTHVTFKFANPKGSGATYNIGWLRGTTQRCRVYRDTLGLYAAPLGRRRGMIIVRP